MKLMIGNLIKVSMQTLYNVEGCGSKNRLFEKDSNEYPTTILANFLNVCINLIFESAMVVNKSNTDFFKLFVYISKIGPEVVNYMVDKRIIARFMDYEYNVVQFKDAYRHMKDVKFKEIEKNMIGL